MVVDNFEVAYSNVVNIAIFVVYTITLLILNT